MLVYYSEPMGVLHLGGYRIYGRGWHRRPIDLPYDLYKDNKSCLTDATYRGDYLREHFNKDIGDIAFTVKELSGLPQQVIASLASQMGVLVRRGPRRDLKSHDVPRTSVEISKEIIKALANVT